MIRKGRCRHCDHLYSYDDQRYAGKNYIVNCRECEKFITGIFICKRCGFVGALLNKVKPEFCFSCGVNCDEFMVEAI